MSNQGGLRSMVRRRLLSDFERGVLDDMRLMDERIEELETQEFVQPANLGGYTLIEEKTPSAVNSVTFSSIPATFRHLRLYWTVQVDGTIGNYSMLMQFNSDTASNYHQSGHTVLKALGAGADMHGISGSLNTRIEIASVPGEGNADNDANEFAYGLLDLPYYAEAKWKGMLATNGTFFGTTRDNVRIQSTSARWKGTAAINTIKLYTVPDFMSGTKMSLYGLG
jgi:hypothetical protein